MRLIPKSSKVKFSIWKGFSFLDLIIAGILCALLIVVLVSKNLPLKWLFAFFVLLLALPLFLENGGERGYKDLFNIAVYLFTPKRFSRTNGKKAKSIDKIIPFREIAEDGTIIFKAGYFARVIEVNPVEFALMSEYEQNLKITQLAQVFNSITGEQEIELIKIDRPIIYDKFCQDIEKLIEKERAGKNDENKIAILQIRLEQLQNLNEMTKTYKPFYYFVLYANDRNELDVSIEYIVNQMETNVEMTVDVLGAEETAVFLKYEYNRDFDEREIKNYARENYVDFITPDEIKFSWTGCEIDGRKLTTYAVADYPLTVGNAWGVGIFDIPNTKVVLRVKAVDSITAIRRIDRSYIELITRDSKADKASKQIDTEIHVRTMAELLKSLRMEAERLFDCTLTVVGYDNDGQNLSKTMKAIQHKLTGQGCVINTLRCRQLDGFITSNITRQNPLKTFERGINSESLSAIFPFAQSLMIEPQGFTLGATGDLPVIIDFWKRGGRYTNSNVTIIGQPGGGKSYFMKFLISLLYSDNSKIFMLDPENEYLKLCESVGGTFVDVGSSRAGIINPFHIYDVLTDDGERAEPRVIYFAHLRFLESFFKLILDGINSDTLELINNLVVECYKAVGITENTDVSEYKAEQFPTFDDLYKLVQKRMKTEKSELIKINLERAEQYLSKFASGGRLANLWNGASTLSTTSRFTVFNFQSLFATKNNDVARAQMLLITKFISQEIINVRELNRNNPTGEIMHPVLFFDEGYQFIDENNPVALDFVFEQYKKIRKYGGMAGFITQNISDFNRRNIADKTTAILKNTQYNFIFPLREGDVHDLVELYSGATQINDVEQYQIANNGRGWTFLISHAKSRMCFEIIAPSKLDTLFNDQSGT